MATAIIAPSISLVNGIPTTTSVDIAQRFEKSHDAVLKAVRRIMAECSNDFRLVNFDESSYVNEQGKPQPAYQLTRDGFTLVAMGFTGKKALAWKIRYIEAFNAMEAALSKKPAPQQLALPSAPTYPDATPEYRRMREDIDLVVSVLNGTICSMQVYGAQSGLFSQMAILQQIRNSASASLESLYAARDRLKDANRYTLMLSR